jgi:hypothetical protein
MESSAVVMGKMVVRLDEKEIIRTVDRAYSDSFGGVTLINNGQFTNEKKLFLWYPPIE